MCPLLSHSPSSQDRRPVFRTKLPRETVMFKKARERWLGMRQRVEAFSQAPALSHPEALRSHFESKSSNALTRQEEKLRPRGGRD